MSEPGGRNIPGKLAIVAVAMFGFGYALVPLYQTVCKYTSLGGRTRIADAADVATEQLVPDRSVVVEFDTNVNAGLALGFGPVQRSVTVHPGQLTEVKFYAENRTGHTLVAQAVPSLAPARASPYFSKTECFCFTQQTLAPGERREMPVRFIVNDALPVGVGVVTLSYTFFEVPGAVADAAPAQPVKQGS